MVWKLPPEKRSSTPSSVLPTSCQTLLELVAVDARRGDVRAQAIDGQQPERKQDALTQVGHAEHVADGGEKLFHGSVAFSFQRSAFSFYSLCEWPQFKTVGVVMIAKLTAES